MMETIGIKPVARLFVADLHNYISSNFFPIFPIKPDVGSINEIG